MMGENKHEARRIFTAALALETPDERARYLDEACQGKPELRGRVEVLLRAHEQASGFLEKTMRVPPPSSDFEIEGAGVMIGHYKLLEKIGEGGFGVVYMAEQKEPVHRKVALKIIKAGMDTKEVVARFEAERQALALMDHPNIAQVFDGGVTQAGRPYFVMELVHGISITEFCDQRDLSTDERLQLFIQVSHAVQHAHQKGIIHRDLKPSNILVTLVNGEPLPKIIDFGVAKALGQQLTDKTLFTGFLRMIGTPAYMSPEQADLSGVDIDTRADIYALGVLLYELLTGVTPFDAETLRNVALDEVRRMIRETDPPKPSTRLHTMGDQLTAVAKHRHAEPAALSRLVRGDLDWIVMKCLEKDRRRRYATPGALVEDIQRHLDHKAVLATPPSAAYLTRKFIRRHRTGVALAASVTIALMAGLIVSLIGFAEAQRERDRAMAAEQQALTERDRAVQAEQSQLEVLDSFVAKSVEDRATIPLLEEGIRVARERLGPTNETYVRLIVPLAQRYAAAGEWAKALELYQVLLERKTASEYQWWSACAVALRAGRRDLCREFSAGMLSRFGDNQNPWALARVRGRTAYMLLLSSDRSSDVEHATSLANQAFDLAPHNPWLQTIKGIAVFRTGNYSEAEAILEKARKHSDPGIRCAAAYYSAMARHSRGETESAKDLLEETNEQFEEFLSAGNLGENWQTHCQNLFIRAEAERLILGREVSPPVTVDSLATASRKRKHILDSIREGYALASEGKWTESAAAYTSALRNPDFHWPVYREASVDQCLGLQMGMAFLKVGDLKTHEQLCRLIIDAELSGPNDPEVLHAERFARLCFYARNLPADLQRREVAMGRYAVANAEKGGYPVWTSQAGGIVEYRAGNFERAVELLLPAEKSPEIGCRGAAMIYRAMALEQLGHDAEAVELLQKAESLLTGPLEQRTEAFWWDLDHCQMALEQARQLIEEP